MTEIDPAGPQSRVAFPSPYGFDSVLSVVFFESILSPSLHEALVGVPGAEGSRLDGPCTGDTNFVAGIERNLHDVEFFFPLEECPGRFRGDSSVAVLVIPINLLAGNLEDRTDESAAILAFGIGIGIGIKFEFFRRQRGKFLGVRVGQSPLKKNGCWVTKDSSVAI